MNRTQYQHRLAVGHALARIHGRSISLSHGFPTHVNIELNSECNRCCEYCPNSVLKRPVETMAPRTYGVVLENLRSLDYTGFLNFNWLGEPMLRSNIVQQVAAAVRHVPRARACLYTNGDLMTPGLALQLFVAGLRYLVITAHHPVDHDWWDTMNSIAREHPKRTVILDDIHYGSPHMYGWSGLVPVGNPKFSKCWSIKNMLVVLANGNVIRCCGDIERLSMGNVLSMSLLDIWRSEYYTALRYHAGRGEKACLPSLCKRCLA